MQIIPDKLAAELRKKTMKEYLQMKVNEEDWHGVADAAMDLREIEVLIHHFSEQERFKENLNKENRGTAAGSLIQYTT